jgi:cytochrome c peroxidase
MASYSYETLEKIMSCKEYNEAFTKIAKHTPFFPRVVMEHVFSAVIFYYSSFSFYDSPFDDAMNLKGSISDESKKGFNVFMGKARCATCHYVPIFNGVKPPFIDSEFEVLGTPADKNFHKLSDDRGRSAVFPEDDPEMLFAFRTPSVRNSFHTKPYMHNGVFETLEEVMDFYNAGGGIGKGLEVESQSLPPDSLSLTEPEIKSIIAFIESLTENIKFEIPPSKLPMSTDTSLNSRVIGGEY